MKKYLLGFLLLCLIFPPLGQLVINKVSHIATGQNIDDLSGWAEQQSHAVAGRQQDIQGTGTGTGTGTGAGPQALTKVETAVVKRVIDGDTLVLADGRYVRLLQIDTPENPDECYSARAALMAQALVSPGEQVRLAADPELGPSERYARLLRYVWRGEVFVNARLVATGAATPYFYDGARGRYADQLERSARQARRAGRGLWAACASTPFDPYLPAATGPRR